MASSLGDRQVSGWPPKGHPHGDIRESTDQLDETLQDLVYPTAVIARDHTQHRAQHQAQDHTHQADCQRKLAAVYDAGYTSRPC